MEYQFTKHAREKFKDLEKYGFHLTEDQVLKSLIRWRKGVEGGRSPRRESAKDMS